MSKTQVPIAIVHVKDQATGQIFTEEHMDNCEYWRRGTVCAFIRELREADGYFDNSAAWHPWTSVVKIEFVMESMDPVPDLTTDHPLHRPPQPQVKDTEQ